MRTTKPLTRPMAMAHYRTARIDLLLVTILTAMNIIFLMTGSGTTMIFSAAVPYYLVAIAWYNGPQWFVQYSLIIAAVILSVYLICWYFSTRHHGWLIAALVLFIMDTLALVVLYWGYWASGIFEALIHVAVLYYLVRGIRAAKALRTMPIGEAEAQPQSIPETEPIRRAEEDSRTQVLAQAQTPIGFLSYRSVGPVRELVINGYVYAELELRVETAHELHAWYAGHLVQAGVIPGSTIRYINLDRQQVVRVLS